MLFFRCNFYYVVNVKAADIMFMPEGYFFIYVSFLVELSPEIDDSDMRDLWIRQAVAETVVLQGDQLSLLTQ